MGNDKFDLFNFYQGNSKQSNRKKFSKDRRSNIFSELVSNLKKYKGEKQSLTVAQNTWIKCITSSISKTGYFLYNIEVNKETFDENAKVPPNLLASWFYPKNRDERLNKISSNRRLLQGKDYLNVNEKKFYFSETIILGKEYYVLKKLGNMQNNNKKFIVNLLWWIGNDVLKLDETYILEKIYVYLSDSDSTVEENITVDNLKEKLGRYFPEEIKRFQIETCCFDEIFNDIIANCLLSLPKETYQFTADCHRYFMLENNCVCYELSNNHIDSLRYNQRVYGKIYAYDSEKRDKDPDAFKNKCVKVTGTFGFDKMTARFKLNVKTIDIISESSLVEDRKNWREECKDILNEGGACLTNLPIITPKKKIGVISQAESKGYVDFMKKLSLDELKKMTDLKQVIRFSAGHISEAIKEVINEKETYQCICIVRGGGDNQQLHEFSKPELLKEIKKATAAGIPVIAAIGHTNDIPLCYEVDGVYGADTPADAGIAIKNQFQKYCKENKTPRKKQK